MFSMENGTPGLRTSGSVVGNFITSGTLKDFSRQDASIGCAVHSASISPDPNTSWHIRIYPGGVVNNSNRKYVSCELSFTSQESFVRFEISLKNSSEETIKTYHCPEWTKPAQYKAFRIENFVPREALLKRLSDDDTLIVVVQLSYSKLSVIRDFSGGSARYDSPAISPQAAASDDLTSLHKTGEYSDVIFRVAGKEFSAHRAILAARSRVFAAMFKHDVYESRSRVVEISDFDERCVSSLLGFVYSGIVDSIDSALALELLQAAEKYDLQDLKTYCSNFLVAELNQHNVLELLVAADVFNAASLRDKCIEYFCQFKSSIDLPTHSAILKKYPNILLDIISKLPERHRNY